MKRRDLSYCIEYIQGLHLRSIDLSLGRVEAVYRKMYPLGINSQIISVAGTNGKGSSAELLASIYAVAGYSVGKYTSPHLVDFNERFEINRKPVDDESLLDAFEYVESARQSTPLTFFEFATLIAIHLFVEAQLDIIVMEVGLGGRLDAVNILDADIALITNISVDHTSWLGNTVEEIAVEKAGIARCERPVVVASDTPPINLPQHLRDMGAQVYSRDQEFSLAYAQAAKQWDWHGSVSKLKGLPMPFEQAGVQLDNAAGVLMVIDILQATLEVKKSDIVEGINNARLAGRCQLIESEPKVILDVSHNEASVRRLAQFIKRQQNTNKVGKCVAVCGMLKDKEIENSLSHIKPLVDSWYLATIHHERGTSAQQLQAYLIDQPFTNCFDKAETAYQAAIKAVKKCDCLVVFGSFHIVGDIIRHRQKFN